MPSCHSAEPVPGKAARRNSASQAGFAVVSSLAPQQPDRYALCQSRILNTHFCRGVLVHDLVAIPFRHFERGQHRAVNRVKQFFLLCLAAALDHIDSEQWHRNILSWNTTLRQEIGLTRSVSATDLSALPRRTADDTAEVHALKLWILVREYIRLHIAECRLRLVLEAVVEGMSSLKCSVRG
jgi:hypothetical protein